MPVATVAQQSFNAGELSPLVHARVDFDKYNNGVKHLLNYIPLVQGPVTRRPGSYFIAEVKDSTKLVRLIPFEFSTEQAYMIEAGDFYFRYFKDNASILEANQNVVSVTQANPGVMEVTAHGRANGDEIYVSGVGGMTELNGHRYILANVTTDTFELNDKDGNPVDTTSFTAYTSGGTIAKVYEITTPYGELDVYDLKYAQSNDVLYIASPTYRPYKLSRTGHTSWTIEQIDFLDGPYLDINAETTTLTPSATSGSITLTASAVTGINDNTGFQSTDVGRLVRFKDSGGNWSWLEITAVTSTTVVTATVKGKSDRSHVVL